MSNDMVYAIVAFWFTLAVGVMVLALILHALIDIRDELREWRSK